MYSITNYICPVIYYILSTYVITRSFYLLIAFIQFPLHHTTHLCCSLAKLCPSVCDPMNCSTVGSLVLHYLPEFAQTRVYIEIVMLSNHLILPSIWWKDTTSGNHKSDLFLYELVFEA